MAYVVENHIKDKWKVGLAEKLPSGILADLNRLIYLSLKGCDAIPQCPTDIGHECSSAYAGVLSVAFRMRLGPETSEYDTIIYLLKKLENLLIVLEYSRVPTVILTSDELDFFEIFFHELNLLGVRASEGMRDDNNDD